MGTYKQNQDFQGELVQDVSLRNGGISTGQNNIIVAKNLSLGRDYVVTNHVNVDYVAEECIELIPGFEVDQGSLASFTLNSNISLAEEQIEVNLLFVLVYKQSLALEFF